MKNSHAFPSETVLQPVHAFVAADFQVGSFSSIGSCFTPNATTRDLDRGWFVDFASTLMLA
jgi:hypothetical protein